MYRYWLLHKIDFLITKVLWSRRKVSSVQIEVITFCTAINVWSSLLRVGSRYKKFSRCCYIQNVYHRLGWSYYRSSNHLRYYNSLSFVCRPIDRFFTSCCCGLDVWFLHVLNEFISWIEIWNQQWWRHRVFRRNIHTVGILLGITSAMLQNFQVAVTQWRNIGTYQSRSYKFWFSIDDWCALL